MTVVFLPAGNNIVTLCYGMCPPSIFRYTLYCMFNECAISRNLVEWTRQVLRNSRIQKSQPRRVGCWINDSSMWLRGTCRMLVSILVRWTWRIWFDGSHGYIEADNAGLILGLHPANERRHYFVTTSLIGWMQAYNQHCNETTLWIYHKGYYVYTAPIGCMAFHWQPNTN